MAEIKIYGTLVNDTAEAIAKTTQVIDPTTGKNVNELIEAKATPKPWLILPMKSVDLATDEGSMTRVADLLDKKFPLNMDYVNETSFPTNPSTLSDHCGFRLAYGTGATDFFLPFANLSDKTGPVGAVEFLPIVFKEKLYRPQLNKYSGENGGYYFTFALVETASASATAKPWLSVVMGEDTHLSQADNEEAMPDVSDLLDKNFPIESVNFPDTTAGLKDYCGLRLEYTDNVYYLPFAKVFTDESETVGSVEFQPIAFNGKLYLPDLNQYSTSPGYYFKFTLIETGSSTSELTAWQKAYLDDLEAKATADKFSASMSLSQSTKALDGQATTVTVYVTPKYDGANVDATITGSGILSGKTFTKGSDGRYSTQVSIPAPTSVEQSYVTSFAATVKYTHPTAGQLTKSVSASHTQTVNAFIFTTAAVADTEVTSNLKQYAAEADKTVSSIKGSHSIPIASGGEYVYFAFPTGNAAPSKFTSSGFDVPITSVVSNAEMAVGSTTIHYRVLRTTSKPQTSPFGITIS